MTVGQIPIEESMLEAVGFTKHIVTPEESGMEQEFYYYERTLSSNTNFCLLTNASDQEGFPTVHLLEVPEYKFTTMEPIIVFLNILEDSLIEENNEQQESNQPN